MIYRILLIIGIHFFLSNIADAQNLVPNGGFESYTGLPNTYAQYYLATGWSNVNGSTAGPPYGSPDYYNELGNNPGAFGPILPNSGDGQMGFYTYHGSLGNAREYVSTQLTSPLIQGEEYELTFYLTNGFNSSYSGTTDNFGIHLSVNALTQAIDEVIELTPTIEVPGIISHQNYWQAYTYTFTANNAATHITFGNFELDNATTIVGGTRAYYFIDDIELVQITSNPVLEIEGDTSICMGESSTLTAINDSSFAWAESDSPSTIISTNSTITVTPAVTTTYLVYGTSDTASITINVYDVPIVNLGNDTTLCEGETLVLDVTTAGASYLWQDNSIDPTFTVSQQGTYSVEVTVGDCSAIDDININYASAPIVNLGNDTTLCEGEILILDATAAGTVSYLWQDNSINSTFTVSQQGMYIVEVMGNNCTTIDTINVNYTPLPTPVVGITDNSGITIDDGIICIGDNAVLTVGTYSDYEWSTGDMTQTTTVTIAGTYTVTVDDGNGCTATAEGIITVNSLPTPTISITETSGIADDDGIICEGDDAVLDAGIFSSYLWENGLMTSSITVGTAGTYIVTVTDGNGCEATTSATIMENSLPTPIISIVESSGLANNDGLICAGDNATLDAGIYDSYLWSTGAMTQTIVVTESDDYSVTVMNSNGCFGEHSVTIVETPILTPSITVSETSGSFDDDGILCIGDAAILDGGTQNAYIWSTGETTPTITVTTAGVYGLTITDFNGCTAETATTIVVNPLPVPVITGNTSFCIGECVALDAGVFDIYSWSSGETTQTIQACVVGDYTVTVTDGNGCENTAMISVSEFSGQSPIITGLDSYCEGGSTVLDAGTFASYQWSNGPTTQLMIASGPSATYTVTVTDGNGCINTAEFAVTESPLPTPIISGETILCIGGGSSTLDAGLYDTYIWSTGEMTQTITVTEIGTYAVTVTDINGCQAINGITLLNEPPLNLQVEAPDDLTCDVQSVVLEANANGAVVYQWSTTSGFIESGADTNTPTVTSSGIYTVTAFSALGCPTSADVQVTMTPYTLSDIYMTIDSIICYGDSTGVITIDSIEGGIEPYLYDFNESGTFTSQTIYNGLLSDTYTITVMDAEGCEFTETIFIDQPPMVTLDLFPVDTLIHLGDSVQLEAFVNPGIPLNDTTWTQTNWLSCTDCLDPWAAPLQNTLYELIVTDTNNCFATATSLVRVENEELIYIPNAFSPNNDGANDVFMIYGGTGVTIVEEFIIFDRWGEVMFGQSNFQPNDPTFGWNGKFKGRKLNPAVFVYYAKVQYDNGITEIFKGDVTLISGGE